MEAPAHASPPGRSPPGCPRTQMAARAVLPLPPRHPLTLMSKQAAIAPPAALAPRPASYLPPMFRQLSPSDQGELQRLCQIETYVKGDTIQTEGELSPRVWTIISGWATVSIKGVIVGLSGPGRIYTAAMGSSPVNVTTFATLGSPMALSFDREEVVRVLSRNPLVLLGFVDLTIGRVLEYQTFLHHRGLASIEQRIAEVLWGVSTPQPDGSRLVPDEITQTVLASLLQTSREEVGKKRKLLVASGHLSRRETGWHLDRTTPMLSFHD